MLDDRLVKELITCEKRVIKAQRKKMLLENRSNRNSFELESIDEKYQFRLFLRQSEEFVEDFSVGLIWTNSNRYTSIKKPIILTRYQGPHDSKAPFESDTHHSFHIHELTNEDIVCRRFQKPSYKCVTDEYVTFEEAVLLFCSNCNIKGLEGFIGLLNGNQIEGQISLNTMMEDDD